MKGQNLGGSGVKWGTVFSLVWVKFTAEAPLGGICGCDGPEESQNGGP
jgi:hypothetical protein